MADRFGKNIQKFLNALHAKRGNIRPLMETVQKKATQNAIQLAAKRTPPTKDGELRGTGIITGQAKAHWETDSNPNPVWQGNQSVTVLANNLSYISYLNDGHRMDRHFVPGLMVNPYSGLLERVPPDMGGMMVGTKTQFVPGLYMREKAIQSYRRALKKQLEAEFEKEFGKHE